MCSARVVCMIVAGIVLVALTGCGAGADQTALLAFKIHFGDRLPA